MMIYKCNNCGDDFSLTEQNKWSTYCFHCGEKGILNFKQFETNELKEDELTRLRKKTI